MANRVGGARATAYPIVAAPLAAACSRGAPLERHPPTLWGCRPHLPRAARQTPPPLYSLHPPHQRWFAELHGQSRQLLVHTGRARLAAAAVRAAAGSVQKGPGPSRETATPRLAKLLGVSRHANTPGLARPRLTDGCASAGAFAFVALGYRRRGSGIQFLFSDSNDVSRPRPDEVADVN
jgi:hypothetical protein